MPSHDQPRPFGDHVPQQLRDQFGRLLAMTAAQTNRLVNEALGEVGARKYHFAVLTTLNEFGPASQAELSDRTGIHRSDLVATVNELADAGHVRREPDPADRRRNTVTMTTAGEERRAELTEILTRANQAILGPLDAGERELLTGMLVRIHDRLAEGGR